MARSSVPKLGPAQRKKWLQILQQNAASPESGHSRPRYRVVLDTNVWVSGLLYGGKPEEVCRLAAAHQELVASEYITEELFAVLLRVIPKIPHRFLRMVRSQLENYYSNERVVAVEISRDPKDDPIVALAIATGAIIVTSDKDLLELEGKIDVPILSVGDALELLK